MIRVDTTVLDSQNLYKPAVGFIRCQAKHGNFEPSVEDLLLTDDVSNAWYVLQVVLVS